jgi:hypothetical protein
MEKIVNVVKSALSEGLNVTQGEDGSVIIRLGNGHLEIIGLDGKIQINGDSKDPTDTQET